ncbi:MAG: RnfABCDGE type electron transport complex subunit D, partial [Magnetococcales bacterium]|nr:RnfABCDGE type electron transport complex subunit D [Magnetococcales bacterium]
DSVAQVMHTVIIALMPATAFAVVMFGWPAVLVLASTMASCMVTERLFVQLRQRPSPLADQSALLTGLLLGLTLPPHAPWWICLLGGFFAIALGKQIHGGLGYNVFNPALIARVFLLISFPLQMTSWPEPHFLFGDHAWTLGQGVTIFFGGDPGPVAGLAVDAVASATPLGQYRTGTGMGQTVAQALTAGGYHFSYFAAGFGTINGSLGETSALLLALGGFYMLRKKLFTWHIPLSMLAGCIVPAAVFWVIDNNSYPSPLFHLLTGGLILGAFFMATDMVTSPVTPGGQLLFGLGCGLLTYVIRTWGGYPEGVSFAIVIMNAAVPLLDQYTRPTVYGKSRRQKKLGL